MVTQLPTYRFTSPEFCLVTLRVRVSDIAERLHLAVDRWEEDGLGPASGMLIRLPSGTVVLVSELEHAIRHLKAEGPALWIGARELVERGVEPLVTEILEDLQLSRDQIDRVATDEDRETAADLLARVESSPLRRAD